MARILVIDDEELVRLTVSQILARDGHTIAEAEDGAKGLAALRQSTADLVITDILMPNKEGMETIVELRQAYPKLKIIAMSGGGRSSYSNFLKVAEKLGADVILGKPFASQELRNAVNLCLKSGR